jgi:hypothetical protein
MGCGEAAQVAALEATVEADQAAIDAARLSGSGFTTITSPLDEWTGLRLTDP